MSNRELSPAECRDLLDAGGVGRLALCTADGPMIYPVNFSVDGMAVVFRTSPHTRLGTHAWGVDVAFEIDQVNWESRQGWSVVVKGRADLMSEPDDIDRLRERSREPHPWASGMRRLYVRIPWREITGRSVGEDWLSSAAPAGQSQFGG